MQYFWKPIEIILPAKLSDQQVRDQIAAQLRVDATAAGEFVQQIQIVVGQHYSDGWLKWTASYLTGPPGRFPDPVYSLESQAG